MKAELIQAWLNVLNIEPKVTVSLNARQAIDIALEYEKLLSKREMNDKKHLQWIHDRIVNVYGENENLDFLIRLRKIIENQTPKRDE